MNTLTKFKWLAISSSYSLNSWIFLCLSPSPGPAYLSHALALLSLLFFVNIYVSLFLSLAPLLLHFSANRVLQCSCLPLCCLGLFQGSYSYKLLSLVPARPKQTELGWHHANKHGPAHAPGVTRQLASPCQASSNTVAQQYSSDTATSSPPKPKQGITTSQRQKQCRTTSAPNATPQRYHTICLRQSVQLRLADFYNVWMRPMANGNPQRQWKTLDMLH